MTSITKAAQQAIAEFDRYFTSANGVDVPERVTVSRDEWRTLRAALQDQAVRGDLSDDDLDKIDMDAEAEANQNPEGTQYHWRKAYLRAFARNLFAAQPAPVVPDRDAITVNLLRHTTLTKAQARALIAHWLDGVVPDAALFKKAAPVVPDDVARDAARYRLIRDGGGWPAAFAAHDAPEPLRGPELDAMLAAQKKGR